jgi:AI-2 transport protein TqsA
VDPTDAAGGKGNPQPGLAELQPAARSEQWYITVSLMVLAAVAVAGALWYTRPVMVPFVLSIFISYLVSPIVDFLRVRWRVPRIGAVALALFVVTVLLGLLALLITTSTTGLINNIELYRERIIALAERAFAILDRFEIDLGQRDIIQTLRQLPLVSWMGRAAGTKFVLSATTGLLVGIILAAFGLELALVFGVMAFLLNFIPSVGSIVATLLPLPVALLQFDNPLMVAAVILFPGALQVTIGNFIEPLVMGEGLDLHPVTIIMGLIFWGLLWGVVGMLLAAPIMAILRIVFARVEITRPVAELLAGRLPRGFPTGEFPVASQ